MTRWWVGVFVTASLLMYFAVDARLVQSAENLPVSQPLVREGDFAVELAQGLLGRSVADENEAENELASIGIAPRNGWIADYPVTPDILGELEKSAARVADSGRLPMTGAEASSVVVNVSVAQGLYVQTASQERESSSAPQPEMQNAVPNPEPEAIEEVYADSGPPVVSYYAPPYDYAYMYSWVPYPFWWTGFWFPGFFVLNDFDIAIRNHHCCHDGRSARVTNHVVDSRTGLTTRINPVTRSSGNSGVSAARSSMSVAERGASRNSVATVRNLTGAGNNAVFRPAGASSAADRSRAGSGSPSARAGRTYAGRGSVMGTSRYGGRTSYGSFSGNRGGSSGGGGSHGGSSGQGGHR